jgi:hypothetical protein
MSDVGNAFKDATPMRYFVAIVHAGTVQGPRVVWDPRNVFTLYKLLCVLYERPRSAGLDSFRVYAFIPAI